MDVEMDENIEPENDENVQKTSSDSESDSSDPEADEDIQRRVSEMETKVCLLIIAL